MRGEGFKEKGSRDVLGEVVVSVQHIASKGKVIIDRQEEGMVTERKNGH